MNKKEKIIESTRCSRCDLDTLPCDYMTGTLARCKCNLKAPEPEFSLAAALHSKYGKRYSGLKCPPIPLKGPLIRLKTRKKK